jgi:hypothetical protein
LADADAGGRCPPSSVSVQPGVITADRSEEERCLWRMSRLAAV